MKERPILFSGAMIRAILAGQKTQTRRVVKGVQFIEKTAPGIDPYWRLLDNPKKPNGGGSPMGPHVAVLCPYGQPGDRLWVRETHSLLEFSISGRAAPVWYWADGNKIPEGDYTRPRPSIHMPRWASRILLEVVSVRVERLQDISVADAIAEGVESCRDQLATNGCWYSEDELYSMLWTQINGHGSWNANPWVWVVEFKRVEGPPL